MEFKDYCKYAFFNGKIVPKEKAVVPVMTNALQYGNGFFGGIRGYYNRNKKSLFVFRLEDHYRRFLKSANIIGVSLGYGLDKLFDLTVDLAGKNRPLTDVYFRPFAYAESVNLSPNLDQDKKFGFCLYMVPLGEYLPLNKGLKVKVSSWRRTPDNCIPSRAKVSGGYVNSSLARKEANDNGFDEAVFLNTRGCVAEGSAENLFLVKGGKVITPSVSEDILEGITRRTVIQIASDLGFRVEERQVGRSELYSADEMFFSGTGVQVSWIGSVDGRQVGSGKRGPVTAQIQDLFFEIVRGENKNYKNWLTKIY